MTTRKEIEDRIAEAEEDLFKAIKGSTIETELIEDLIDLQKELEECDG